MKTYAFAIVALISLSTTTQAARERASYELGLTSAIAALPTGDSVLAVQADSTKKNAPAFRVEHDSLTFVWTPTGKWVEYQLRNDTRGPVRIIWDSASAIDPEGRLMRLVPYEKGDRANWEFSIPARKVGAGAHVEGGLGVVKREATGALVLCDMLPLRNEDFPFADFGTTVQEQVGRTFRLIVAVERNGTIQRFSFIFVVRQAQIRTL